jgi:hypothetical protein
MQESEQSCSDSRVALMINVLDQISCIGSYIVIASSIFKLYLPNRSMAAVPPAVACIRKADAEAGAGA